MSGIERAAGARTHSCMPHDASRPICGSRAASALQRHGLRRQQRLDCAICALAERTDALSQSPGYDVGTMQSSAEEGAEGKYVITSLETKHMTTDRGRQTNEPLSPAFALRQVRKASTTAFTFSRERLLWVTRLCCRKIKTLYN